jgi:hypothetical protein
MIHDPSPESTQGTMNTRRMQLVLLCRNMSKPDGGVLRLGA